MISNNTFVCKLIKQNMKFLSVRIYINNATKTIIKNKIPQHGFQTIGSHYTLEITIKIKAIPLMDIAFCNINSILK